MYLQFYSKEYECDTVKNLLENQNESLKEVDDNADIRVYEQDGLLVREANLPSYPTPEVTVFRDFERFIAFIVLYCPECYVIRDTKKAIDILNKAIPLNVVMKDATEF